MSHFDWSSPDARRHKVRRRHGQFVAAGFRVALLLAGCSTAGQATDDAAQQGGAASSEDPAGVEPTDASRYELLSLNAEKGVRADLREFRCGVRNGVWNSGESVTNPGLRLFA